MTVTVPPTGMEVNHHLSTSALNKEASHIRAELACCFVALGVFFVCANVLTAQTFKKSLRIRQPYS